MNENEYQIVKGSCKSGISISKGDKKIEMSPEVSMQICTEMVTLGSQLISEVGGITIEYFKAQTAIYYGELNAYIQNQSLKSNERQMILSGFEKLTEKYLELIDQANDKEKREELKNTYCDISKGYYNFYMDALNRDNDSLEKITRPSLLSEIKKMFKK